MHCFTTRSEVTSFFYLGKEELTVAVGQTRNQSGKMCVETAPEEFIAARISAGAPQFGTLFVLEGEDAPRRV